MGEDSVNKPRKGFTINGQPIPKAGEEPSCAVLKVEEESGAYFFWAIYLTLVVLAMGNLLTTGFIFSVLRLSSEGLQSLELPQGDRDDVRMYGQVDMEEMVTDKGVITGRKAPKNMSIKDCQN